MISAADIFLIYDDMQYTRRDWRNRNLIKTSQGLAWLTVPVRVKGRYQQKIYETEIQGNSWAALHWRSIEFNYAASPFFPDVARWLRPLYLEREYNLLTDLNRTFITAICDYLGIRTKILDSRDFALIDGKSERLADLCVKMGCDSYLSGPAAKDYIVPAAFSDRGIDLQWFDYSGYPPYKQRWGAFEPGVSILDLLLNCGKSAPQYMRHVRP